MMFLNIQVEISISVMPITQHNAPSCITTKSFEKNIYMIQERKGKGSNIVIYNS